MEIKTLFNPNQEVYFQSKNGTKKCKIETIKVVISSAQDEFVTYVVRDGSNDELFVLSESEIFDNEFAAYLFSFACDHRI